MRQKIALITGGSRGLGKNIAQHLAKRGTDCIITYYTKKDEAETVVAELEASGRKAVALKLDTGVTADFDAFVLELKAVLLKKWQTEKFDYLVNNAGHGATIPFEKGTEEDFDRMMNVHFKGVYFLTQKTLPLMNEGASIVNLSSGTTRFCNPGYSLYASMKGGVETFTKYLAKELGVKGIRANVVAPGPVKTDFNNAFVRSSVETQARMSSVTALSRVGEPDDIGPVVAFLCSDDSRWVTGQRIEASGGINI